MDENKQVSAAAETSQPVVTQAANAKCTDCRTFVIALVTSIIVVTLYHIGTMVYKTYFKCAEQPQIQRVYVEVGEGQRMKKRFHHGEFRKHPKGERFRKGAPHHPHMKREFMRKNRPGKPVPAQPAAAQPAPAKPAAEQPAAK